MDGTQQLPIKYLTAKALLLSALAHIIAFNLFLFEWRIIPEGKKPQLNFLGSILSASDVIIPLTSAEERSGSTVNYQFRNTLSSIFETDLPKPIHRKQYVPDEKRTIKEMTVNQGGPQAPETAIPKGTRIDLETEPYKPLRMRIND